MTQGLGVAVDDAQVAACAGYRLLMADADAEVENFGVAGPNRRHGQAVTLLALAFPFILTSGQGVAS